jgi:hypothetical protein
MQKSREGNVSGLEIALSGMAALFAALNGVLLVDYKNLRKRLAKAEETSSQIKDNYISRFEKVHAKIGELNTELKVELASTKGEILMAISNLQVEMGKSFVQKPDCEKNCNRVIEQVTRKPRRGR